MAEPIPPPSGNANHLALTIGSKSLGLTTKDLISILLIVGGIVGGYLIFINVQDGQKLLYHRQTEILKAVQDNARFIPEIEELRQMLRTHEYNQGRELMERMPLEFKPPERPPPDRAP